MNSNLLPCAIQFNHDTILNTDASLVQILKVRYADKTYLSLFEQRKILSDLVESIFDDNIKIWIFNTFQYMDYKGMDLFTDREGRYIDNVFYIAVVIEVPELRINGAWNSILSALRFGSLKNQVQDRLNANVDILNVTTDLIQVVLKQYFNVEKLFNQEFGVERGDVSGVVKDDNRGGTSSVNGAKEKDAKDEALSQKKKGRSNAFLDFYYLLLTGLNNRNLYVDQPMFDNLESVFKHKVQDDFVSIFIKSNVDKSNIIKSNVDKSNIDQDIRNSIEFKEEKESEEVQENKERYAMVLSLRSIFNLSENDIIKIYNIADSEILITQVIAKNLMNGDGFKEREIIDASADETLQKANQYDKIYSVQSNIIIYGDNIKQVRKRIALIGDVLYELGLSFVVEDSQIEDSYFSVLPGNISFLLRLSAQDLRDIGCFFVFLKRNLLFAKLEDTVSLNVYADQQYNINISSEKENYFLAAVNDNYSLGFVEMLLNQYDKICVYSRNFVVESIPQAEYFNMFQNIDLLKRFLLFIVEVDKGIVLDVDLDEVQKENMIAMNEFCNDLYYCVQNEKKQQYKEQNLHDSEIRKEFLLKYTTANKIISDVVYLLKQNLYVFDLFPLKSIKYEQESVVSIAYILILVDILPKKYILFVDGFVRIFAQYPDLCKSILSRAKENNITLFCTGNVSHFDLDEKHLLENIVALFGNLLIINSLESNIVLNYNFGLNREDKQVISNTTESLIVKNKDGMYNIEFFVFNWYLSLMKQIKNKKYNRIIFDDINVHIQGNDQDGDGVEDEDIDEDIDMGEVEREEKSAEETEIAKDDKNYNT